MNYELLQWKNDLIFSVLLNENIQEKLNLFDILYKYKIKINFSIIAPFQFDNNWEFRSCFYQILSLYSDNDLIIHHALQGLNDENWTVACDAVECFDKIDLSESLLKNIISIYKRRKQQILRADLAELIARSSNEFAQHFTDKILINNKNVYIRLSACFGKIYQLKYEFVGDFLMYLNDNDYLIRDRICNYLEYLYHRGNFQFNIKSLTVLYEFAQKEKLRRIKQRLMELVLLFAQR